MKLRNIAVAAAVAGLLAVAHAQTIKVDKDNRTIGSGSVSISTLQN